MAGIKKKLGGGLRAMLRIGKERKHVSMIVRSYTDLKFGKAKKEVEYTLYIEKNYCNG